MTYVLRYDEGSAIFDGQPLPLIASAYHANDARILKATIQRAGFVCRTWKRDRVNNVPLYEVYSDMPLPEVEALIEGMPR